MAGFLGEVFQFVFDIGFQVLDAFLKGGQGVGPEVDAGQQIFAE